MRRYRVRLSNLAIGLILGLTASCGDGGDIGGPPAHVERVEVSPPQARAAVGGTLNYIATAYDASGRPVTSGVTYLWSSDRPGVAVVDRTTGQARGVANGAATIRVRAADDRGSAQGGAVLRV